MTRPFGTTASLAGPLVDRPAPDPNQVGRYYLATDEGDGVQYRDNGVTWDYCGGRRYRSYAALLNQNGANAPVATVLDNTLGFTPVWSRESIGDYRITSVDGFPYNKTQCFYGNRIQAISEILFGPYVGFNNFVELLVYGAVGVSDDLLIDFPIEIRVYS